MSSSKQPTDSTDTQCFFQISIGGEVQRKRVVMELDTELCPKTSQSFINLCTSTETTTPRYPKPSYRGCEFHRIIPGFVVQCGDFERFDGTGGYSPLYGKNFPDEYLKGKHDGAGLLSMANSGKNTNGSQFFITLQATPHLDGKHVVFGKVISGMETIQRLVQVERDARDRPVMLQKCVIVDCGIQGMESDEDSKDHMDGDLRRKKSRNKKKKKKLSKSKKRKRKHEDNSSSSSDDSSHRDSKRRSKKKNKRSDRKDKDEESSVSSASSSSSSYERRKKKKRKKHKR